MYAHGIFSLAISGILLLISCCGKEFLVREPVGVAAGSIMLKQDGDKARVCHRGPSLDLRRWGIDSLVLTDYIIRDGKFRMFLRWTKYDPEKNDYWPLPKSEVILQKGIL